MEPNAAHHLDPTVLIGVAVMLIVAKIGGEIFERLKQPAVLGELFAGIVLGNLVVFGFTTAEPLKTNDTIAALAELGVIILLFEVGLESDLKEMMEVGWSSLLVAVVGVVAPLFLGWSVSSYFLPNEPQLIHVFIGATSVLFLIGSIVIGHFLMPRLLRGAGRLETRGVLLTFAISMCLIVAWAAGVVGLAPIVGAFAAGLVLDEVHYRPKGGRTERDLHDLLQPVSTVLVPIFFVLMGLKVDVRLFARLDILGFAAALTIAAILGKQVCGLAVLERGINRISVGLGMIPRGEVGLIFAGIGATLMLPSATGANEPVISPVTFGAVVIMVIITTLVTPPSLKWSLGRKRRASPKREDAHPRDED